MGGIDVLHIPEAWCAIDASGNVRRANAASLGRLGRAPQGASAKELFGPSVCEALERVRQRGQPEVIEDERGLRWFLSPSGDEVHCLGLPGRSGIVGRALSLVAKGAPLPDVLRAVTRDVAATWPGSHCVIELWDADGPLLIAAAPGAAPKGDALLEAAPTPGLHQLGPSSPLVRALGAPLGLNHATLFAFDVREPALRGAVALFLSEPMGASPGVVSALGDLVAAAARAWDVEREGREVAERYRLLTEATQHAIYDWDIQSDTLHWTSRVAVVFGHPVTDDLTHDAWWTRHLHAEDFGRVTQSLQRALAEGERFWTSEYRIRCADGRYTWVFDRGAIVYDGSGRAVRMVGVLEDISRDRQLESQLDLASRLAAVGSLASGVAHELNNPLTWVTSNLGFAIEELQKLHRENEDARERLEEALDALDDAKAGAERIAQIVSDLRTFAHGEADGLHPVAAHRAVESALAMADNELRHWGRLVRDVKPLPTVLANEARLCQAVLNLLLNAAWSLAARPGANHEVRVATSTDDAGYAVIEVSDTGPGISPDVLPRIFDPFFSTRPTGDGLGLGLSVAHSIITGIGGTIEVDSELGRGSTFRIKLPPLRRAPETPTPAPARTPTRRGQIVVIDDEAALLVAFQHLLGEAHEVRVFERGLDALPSLKESPPDLIFCDVMMPELTVAELYQRICDVSPGLASRVVFMTGGAFTEAARDFLARTKATVLEKPFSPQDLREVVAAHLESNAAPLEPLPARGSLFP
jgi:PAS domain S-box-containing protein